MKQNYDLLKIGFLKAILKARSFQFITQVPMVLIFVLVILTGLLGTQIPGKNLATVLTWTIWWAGIIFLILFAGAAWCLFCPWMAVGNWVQRLAFWKKSDMSPGLEKKYNFSRNRYPAIAFFFIVSALELGILITYSPMYTALLALVMFMLAVATALIWEKNIFCRYICFVGAIVGIYSNLSPVEVRRKDQGVCGKCKTKDCITGNDKGYGCPIYEFPGGMDMNTNCTLCTECLKTCPDDNMTINARPFLADLSGVFKGRMDEAILVLVLLGLTVFHGVTMMPEWFFWANESLKGNYAVYLVSFLVAQTAFALVPLLFHALLAYLYSLFARAKEVRFRDVFIQFSYSFLPVAISFHLAHNLAHIRKEGYKIFSVVSDPFGWGWDLFGTAKWAESPITHQMHTVENQPHSPDHSMHNMPGHSMPEHATHEMPEQAMPDHGTMDHSMHEMSGQPMAHPNAETHKMEDPHMGHNMDHSMPIPEAPPDAAMAPGTQAGHDMDMMHEMATQSGMMMHQPEFNYYNLVLISLGLLGGIFLAYRTSSNTFGKGSWKGAVLFFIAIALYSYFSWYLLNQPMVMRTE